MHLECLALARFYCATRGEEGGRGLSLSSTLRCIEIDDVSRVNRERRIKHVIFGNEMQRGGERMIQRVTARVENVECNFFSFFSYELAASTRKFACNNLPGKYTRMSIVIGVKGSVGGLIPLTMIVFICIWQ